MFLKVSALKTKHELFVLEIIIATFLAYTNCIVCHDIRSQSESKSHLQKKAR